MGLTTLCVCFLQRDSRYHRPSAARNILVFGVAILTALMLTGCSSSGDSVTDTPRRRIRRLLGSSNRTSGCLLGVGPRSRRGGVYHSLWNEYAGLSWVLLVCAIDVFILAFCDRDRTRCRYDLLFCRQRV